MKTQESGRKILTASGEPGDNVIVSIEFEGAYGPTDALLAEIAFILADSGPRETTVSLD